MRNDKVAHDIILISGLIHMLEYEFQKQGGAWELRKYSDWLLARWRRRGSR